MWIITAKADDQKLHVSYSGGFCCLSNAIRRIARENDGTELDGSATRFLFRFPSTEIAQEVSGILNGEMFEAR